MLELKKETNVYVDKNGQSREAVNYYVEVDLGGHALKVQLRPSDYTGREILEAYYK